MLVLANYYACPMQCICWVNYTVRRAMEQATRQHLNPGSYFHAVRSAQSSPTALSWIYRYLLQHCLHFNQWRDELPRTELHLRVAWKYELEFGTRYTKTPCFVYRVYRYIHDSKNLIHDTYRIILGLQFSIVVQQTFINFFHNFAKFSQIFLKVSLNVLKFS